MTGTLILICYGFACEFIVPSNNECSIVEVVDYVDDDGNVHMKQSIVNNSDDSNDEKSQEDSNTEEDNNENSSDDTNITSGDDSRKDSNKKNNDNNNSNPSNDGSNEGSQPPSTDSSGGAEPNRRWIPEKYEYIEHPAETKQVKHPQITCMCGQVFTGTSVPNCVGAWQAHRPNP